VKGIKEPAMWAKQAAKRPEIAQVPSF